MKKMGAVLVIIALISVCYLFLLVVMPVINGIIVSANATIVSDVADPSAYPGAQDAMIAAPWPLFFVPGVVGIVAIILVLRAR